MSSRFPEDNFPLDLEVKGRSALARAINITMRVEKDTPEGCCSGEMDNFEYDKVTTESNNLKLN